MPGKYRPTGQRQEQNGIFFALHSIARRAGLASSGHHCCDRDSGAGFREPLGREGLSTRPSYNHAPLRAPLPGYYGYPSFDYWVTSAALLPEIVQSGESTDRGNKLQAAVGSHYFLLRVRAVFLVIAALSILWVYLLVLKWRAAWQEALLAACFFAFSWEVAYHIRWIATDGILMQFGALTLLCTMVSYLNPDGTRWLYLAAGAAGLGMGTNILGLIIGTCHGRGIFTIQRSGMWPPHSTPIGIDWDWSYHLPGFDTRVIFWPAEVLSGILYEVRHYASGHAGHTVSPGAEHGWRMLVYLSSSVFSHFPIIALIVFGFSFIGVVALIREDRNMATVALCFPLLYFLYFSIQRAMVVRNLLVLVPFLAVLAARGIGTVVEVDTGNPVTGASRIRFCSGNPLRGCHHDPVHQYRLAVYAAGTIVDRHSTRFAGDAIKHIEQESWNRFWISPLVRVQLEQVAQDMPTNVTPGWRGQSGPALCQ